MNKHEILLILKNNLKEAVIDEIIMQYGKMTEGVYKIEKFGEKQLAYTIKRHKKGYCLSVYCNMTEEQKQNISIELMNDENILKFMIIKN